MGILAKLTARPQRAGRSAAFPGAQIGRLTSSWTSDPGAINRWLRYELRTIRARSRQLARGDAYGAKFIRSCVNNIAGPRPFIMQAKARKLSQEPFDAVNDTLETAYAEWSKPGGCEITGKLSLAELDRLLIRCLARDGEYLVRILRGPDYPGGRLQLLDIDRLDEQLNANLGDGVGAIKMGVQIDPYGKPVAYHVLRQHPGELGEWASRNVRERDVIPADQIFHGFIADWPEQVRGLPWMHAAMVRLYHLGQFEEAAVINARIGATKIAVLETPDGDVPASLATGKDSQGNLLTDATPGEYWTLPEGVKLGSFNPQFPDASVEPFIAACLRGAAAGCGMAYHSFANDPGAVNYSTARVALLEERDMWSTVQGWYVEHLVQPRFENWLNLSVLAGALPQNYRAYKDSVRWQCKTWAWIDPQKETTANVEALNAKLTSRTRIASDRGEDIEDIFEELAQEDKLAKKNGIELTVPAPASSNANAQSQAIVSPAEADGNGTASDPADA